MAATQNPTPAGGTGPEGGGPAMSAAGRAEFEAEVSRLRASNNSGPTDQKVGIAGVVVAVVGLVVILVCYSQTRSYSDQRDQMESLVLALFGLGLVILGSVMYLRNSLTRFLRFWLVRLIYEQRDLARGDERLR